MSDDRPERDAIIEQVFGEALGDRAPRTRIHVIGPGDPIPARILDWVRARIERIADAGGFVARYLVLVVFAVGILNVILRYWGRATDTTLVSNRWIDVQWQLFGVLFLVGFPYGIKEKVNPRVDFWHANFTARRKALIDFVLHTVLLLPYAIFGVRVVWPFAMSALGRRFDGTWPTWKVWTTWENSSNPNGLPVGPIKAMIVVGFVLFGLQVIAEMIKAGFVLAGLAGEELIEEPDVPVRIE